MKPILRAFLLGLTALLLLAGCAAELVVSEPTVAILETASPPATASPRPTQTVTPLPDTPTPAPSATNLPVPTATVLPPSSCSPDPCFYPTAGLLGRPAEAPYVRWIDPSYPFGSTQGGQREMHSGVEFANPNGTPILSAGDGEVVYAGSDREQKFAAWPNIYGNLIVIRHPPLFGSDPIYTLYGHLSSIDVTAGEQVRRGQVIGAVGATGAATGSHLHFEVREGTPDFSSARNPLLFLDTASDASGLETGVLAGRVETADGKPVTESQINLEPLSNPSGEIQAYYIETYASKVASSAFWQENFAADLIPPGNYRLTANVRGRIIERFVPVQSGRITYILITVGE